jgi:hypothetical protein
MKINLLDLPVLYVNLDKDTGKNIRAKNALEGLGFQKIIRIPGERHENTRIGCALGHLKALFTVRPPFIIVEDDIAVKSFKSLLEIPDDTDGLYLGTSLHSWDGLNWSNEGVTHAKQRNFDDIYRIYDMLSTTAILYITPTYVEQTIKDIYRSVLAPYAHDLEMATSQRKCNVYCVGDPMFYQDDPGGNKYAESFTYHHIEKNKR